MDKRAKAEAKRARRKERKSRSPDEGGERVAGQSDAA